MLSFGFGVASIGGSQGPDFLKNKIRANTKDAFSFLAELDGEPVGAGGMNVHAGVALMAGAWASFGLDLEPGQLNALLVLGGQKTFPFDNVPVTTTSADHPHGAGHLRMPDLDGLGSGGVFLMQGETRELIVGRSREPISRINVALWWADSLADQSGGIVHMHSRVDVAIIDPAGVVQSSSTEAKSVFQRCSATNITPGAWRMRITAHEMREQPLPGGGTVLGQKIYWANGLSGP